MAFWQQHHAVRAVLVIAPHALVLREGVGGKRSSVVCEREGESDSVDDGGRAGELCYARGYLLGEEREILEALGGPAGRAWPLVAAEVDDGHDGLPNTSRKPLLVMALHSMYDTQLVSLASFLPCL